MAAKVQSFLMFQDGKAEEAMNFYVSLIPGSKVTDINYYGPDGPGAEGQVMTARFSLANQSVMCIDSPVQHQFNFTPSFSFFVTCESEEEIQRLSSALLEGGVALMPLDNYGFSRQFTWVNDRYGVSWQLNLE